MKRIKIYDYIKAIDKSLILNDDSFEEEYKNKWE